MGDLMKDDNKTKRQLVHELTELRSQNADGYHEVDIKGNFTFFNESMRKIMGYEREELLGMNNRQYADEENTRKVYQVYNRVYRTGEPVKNFEWQIIRKDGARRDIEVSISLIRDAEGHPTGFRGIVRDTTERKQAEEELRKSESRFRSYFDLPLHGIAITSPEKGWIEVNDRFCSIMGYTRDEIVHMTWSEMTHPDDLAADAGQFEHLLSGQIKQYQTEKRFIRKDGKVIWISLAMGCVRESDDRVNYIIVLLDDITDRKRIEEALRDSENRYRELSIVDDLTQLYNSRHFYHQLRMEIDRVDRYGQPLTLLLLDLDDFKRFNDAYGHIEGDQVLSRLGQVVKRCLRQTDSAYRYGGEEFTILLPMTTSADGAVTAERIRTEFKEELFSPAPGQDVRVTVSIGLAQYKPQGDMKAFVHRVDQLMYQGKKNGKDRVCSEP
jgi:diguanylate cyclase (GGDEF)-like protein/PAS domain S-box-containing protein